MIQANKVYESVLAGKKIDSRGAFLGNNRLSEPQMRNLSEIFQIESGQVYTRGKRKKGGGGYYLLYSGTINRIFIPINKNEYLINHTHPLGTQKPSIFDVQYLKNAEIIGSFQRKSTIFPIGFPSFQFNKYTQTA